LVPRAAARHGGKDRIVGPTETLRGDDRLRLSADVGGTFTDIAGFDAATGRLLPGKTLTTPGRLADGIETGVAKAGAGFAQAQLFLHGTTVTINTILERSGARCALLTTQGFRDIYEIGRVNRLESYNLFFRKHEPLIERRRRFEIRERIDAQGTVLIPLDEDEVRRAAASAIAEGAVAIAIVFLHSYRNPAHEQRAKETVARDHPELFVTASHELSQEYREFERTSTAAANAYVGPRVRRYLGETEDHLQQSRFAGSFLIVQSLRGRPRRQRRPRPAGHRNAPGGDARTRPAAGPAFAGAGRVRRRSARAPRSREIVAGRTHRAGDVRKVLRLTFLAVRDRRRCSPGRARYSAAHRR
jgi:hypothetical protein